MAASASRRFALLLACAAALAAGLVLAYRTDARAERVAVGRFVEIRHGVSRKHPCYAEAMDARRTGRSRIRVGESAPSLLWKLEIGAGEMTAPAVAEDGTLYLGTAAGVAAVEPDGRLRWVKRVGAVKRQPALNAAGNALAVTEGGALLELSPQGAVRRVPSGRAVTGFPLVLDSGLVAAATGEGNVAVFDLQGASLGTIASGHRGRVAIARLSSGLMVSAGRDASLHVFSADGAQHRALELGAEVLAGPVVGDDDTIWVVRDDGSVAGLSAGGRLRALARLDLTSSRSVPALGRDGGLRVGTVGNDLACLGPDGALRWRVVVDGRLGPVTLDADDLALAVSSRGVLYGVEPDGRRRFRVRVGAHGAPRPVPGEGGVIYIAADTGTLSAWK